MKQIINQNSDSANLQNSCEIFSYNNEKLAKLRGKSIKNIIKSLQVNYNNILRDEENKIYLHEGLRDLLPQKTVNFI